MKHGTYHEDGPDSRLWFKSALLRDDPEDDSMYLTQFDALYLEESHGWHSKPKKYFVNVEGTT